MPTFSRVDTRGVSEIIQRLAALGIVGALALVILFRFGAGSSSETQTSLSPVGIEIPWLPAEVLRWELPLVVSAQRYGVDPELLAIIVLVESGGNPKAGSEAGARGLMQVMPETAEFAARDRGVQGFSPSQLDQGWVGLDIGAYYLSQQLESFGVPNDSDWQKSIELAAAAYNGGPGMVSSGREWPQETKDYVHWVSGMWRERHESESPTYLAWLSAGGSRLVWGVPSQPTN